MPTWLLRHNSPICFVKHIGSLPFRSTIISLPMPIRFAIHIGPLVVFNALGRYVSQNISAQMSCSALFADMFCETYRPISAFQRFSPIHLAKHIGPSHFGSMCPSQHMSAYYAWTLLVPWPPLRFKGIIVYYVYLSVLHRLLFNTYLVHLLTLLTNLLTSFLTCIAV